MDGWFFTLCFFAHSTSPQTDAESSLVLNKTDLLISPTMKPEQQVCNSELANGLKELGMKQESLFGFVQPVKTTDWRIARRVCLCKRMCNGIERALLEG
jgi:hypothetical protein